MESTDSKVAATRTSTEGFESSMAFSTLTCIVALPFCVLIGVFIAHYVLAPALDHLYWWWYFEFRLSDDDFDDAVTCPTTGLYACLDGTLTEDQLDNIIEHGEKSIGNSLWRYGFPDWDYLLGVFSGPLDEGLGDAMVDPHGWETLFVEMLSSFIVRLQVPADDEGLLRDLEDLWGGLAIDEDLDVIIGYCSDNAR